MSELRKRRRALIQQGDKKFWIYNKGYINPVISGLSNVGYSQNSTYNKKAIEATYLRLWNTTETSGGNYQGGRSFTTGAHLPADLVGKTLYLSGYYSNSANSGINDRISVYVSETVANSYNLNTAYPNNINTYFQNTASRPTLAQFNLQMSLTKTGFMSVCCNRQGSGIYEIQITEIWVE